MSGVCGLLIPTIGIDVGTGAQRYSMGIIELYGGIDFIIVAMGICCIGEILYAVSESSNKQTAKNNTIVIPRIEHELQRFLEMLVLVFVIFFGIPCSQVMAIIVGAIESYGIAFFQIWETITDMSMTIPAFISICFLIPLLSKKLLTITKRINMKINGIYKETFSPVALHPIFVIAAFVGAYSLNYRLFDMFLLVAFGILGCAMKQLSFPTTPLIICAAFGPRLEEAYRAPFSWSPLTALFYFLSVVTLIIYIKKACERQQ
jgi:putative tricarboxylic transport membrane protein